MKKIAKPNWLFVMLVLSLSFIQCSKKKNNHGEPENGSLLLNIQKSQSDQMTIRTLRSVPIEQYHVTILTSSDEIYAEYNRYDAIPETITLEAGDYYVTAHSNNDSIAAFENPYLYGQSEVFSIGAGQVSMVDVVCEIANCAVSVDYSPQILNNFSDYYTVIKIENDSLYFSGNESRSGYFQCNALSIYAILSYPLTGGGHAEKRIEGQIGEPEAGNMYAITIDASFGNMQTGIQISLLEEMDTIPLEFNDFLNVNDLSAGDLLITEIMYDPSVIGDTEGEWIEVYNNSTSTVNLQNLVLQSGDDSHIVSERIILNAGGYFAMARADTAFEGDKYIYSGINLTNSADEISLYTYGTDGTNGSLLAHVEYDESNGFPNGAGESINLDPDFYDFDEAQLSTSWCLSIDTFNTGDYGTPGMTNNDCD